MEIKSLEHTPLPQLVEAFNKAFSDYFVPLKLTEEQLRTKIHVEGINLEYSVGAFQNDCLVGFILHGCENTNGTGLLYNAGTGVLPSYRGRKLTVKMYEYILPVLVKNNFTKVILEVIDSNQAAFKVYGSIGFEVVRTLNCYKGHLNTSTSHVTLYCEDITDMDWNIIKQFWDWQPSWQNSISAIQKALNKSNAILHCTDKQLTGYLIFNTDTARIQQFAVHKDHRNSGIGRALFDHFGQIFGKQATIINVDGNSHHTNSFLAGIGLQVFIRQFEMQLVLQTKDE